MAFRRNLLDYVHLSVVILIAVLILSSSTFSGQEIKNITIGGAFSLSGNDTTWGDCLMATLLAIDHINNDSSLLPGYRLNMEWGDTKVKHNYDIYYYALAKTCENSTADSCFLVEKQ